MNKNFYITTTLPYVNAAPHVGFASEIILADVRARFARVAGQDVVFNTGTDEHGIKIWQKAQEEGKEVQVYVDEYAPHFDDLKKLLDLDYTHFIRTTNVDHMRAAQEMWKRVDANGFIYKKQYSVKYCVGCELEKTDSELDHGQCPMHPGKDIEMIEEENYFFKFSAFQKQLLALYEQEREFVVPQKRLNEIRSFTEGGLQDFSISRLKEKMPWGVEVPGDKDHVMYVWFDALTNYISTLGWPENTENFQKYWGTKDASNAIQIAGKDNLRQQSAMWQAMLMAAELPTSKQVFINGFISVDGQKMSKSIGNVIAPSEMVERYGVDGTRYILLTKGNFGEDTDISWEKMDATYNADLANGLGNLASRILTLASDVTYEAPQVDVMASLSADVEVFETKKALGKIWKIVDRANKLMEEKQPWTLKKKEDKISKTEFKELMERFLQDLHMIAILIEIFLPETSQKILAQLESRKKEILFERVSLTGRVKKYIVENNLSKDGVNVKYAICLVASISKRRGSKLEAQIATVLSDINVEKSLNSAILQEYRKLHTKSGEDGQSPAEYLLSIVQETGKLPNINRVVDSYNIVSLKSLLSIGIHDLNAVQGDMRFDYTNGSEKYTPLGKVSEEKVRQDVYAFVDEEKVLCYMDVKQCDQSKVTKDTREFIVYVQGNKEASEQQLSGALDDVCNNLKEFCGAEIKSKGSI